MADLPTLAQLRANDSAAWAEAYALLWRAVLSVVHATLGPARVDAENVAANILAEEIVPGVLQPRSDSFNQISTFDDLLSVSRAIARNRTIDFIRRSARRPEMLMAELPEVPAEASSGRSDLLAMVSSHLQPPDPELFHERFVLGYTTREIAERRGMSHGTVVSRFARALENLRQVLGAELQF